MTNINVTNINYRNQRVNGAMTAVPQDQFAGSRRIGRGATIVNVNDARNLHIVGAGAPVTPTQQSVLVRRQDATAPVRRPPESAQNRQVVWKNTPPPRRTTFASHADQLKTTGDKPVVPPTIAQTRGAPRSAATRPISHTDAPAPTPRPNVNVQRPPEVQARPNNAPVPAKTPTAPSNPNVRAVPNTQPRVIDRPAPIARPNTNDRPAPRMDGPSPVNGSPNGSPAHTIAEPNQNGRPVPHAPPTETPRVAPSSPPNSRPVSHSDVQPIERQAPTPVRSAQPETRRSPVQGENPRPNTAPREAPPKREVAPPRQTETRQAPERRVPAEQTKQPEQDSKPPHRG